jgi:hypothetical protein
VVFYLFFKFIGMDGKAVIEEESKIPYQLQASINEPGLGLLSWWNS